MPTWTPWRDRRVHGPSRRVLLIAALAFALWRPASADIVHLATGATLSVERHELAGDRIVLHLRAGGSIVCDRSLVLRVTADEVPYPDPADEEEGTVSSSSASAPRTSRFSHLIRAAAGRHGIDPRLLEAVIAVESNFEHRARSAKGAMGLMQLMPGTARQYAVDNPYDPARNIDAGARHLRLLLDRFELRLALAAYNAGEGAVRRHGGIPPFPETRAYVARILSLLGSTLPPRS